MKIPVFIKGNYGPSNLGDDVLLTMMIRVLSEIISPEDVYIEVQKPELASKLFPGVKFLANGSVEELDAKIAIYGGGGQFFSFPEYRGLSLQSQRIARVLSGDIKLTQLYDYLKRNKRQIRRIKVNADKKCAFGIGVGPFVDNSPEINATKTALKSCQIITVRDKESKQLCENWGIEKVDVIPDPTFLADLWSDKNSEKEHICTNRKVSIGAIFRSWPFDSIGKNYFSHLQRTMKRVSSEGVKVNFISLSLESERELCRSLAKTDEDVLTWDPKNNTPYKFIKQIRDNCDLVVSARAHGVVLPATMGVPGICVGIEPKLKNIHAMLPNSTKLWKNPFDELELAGMIKNMVELNKEYKTIVRREVANNCHHVEEALNKVNNFIKKSLS